MKKHLLPSLTALAVSATFALGQAAPETPGIPQNATTNQAQAATSENAPVAERQFLLGDWGGLRSEEQPIQFELGYTQEYLGVIGGGIHRRGEYNALATLGVDVDLEKLLNWSGAKFHATGLGIIGRSLSGRDIGDDSNLSNINYRNSVRLFEAWLEQSFFGERFSIRVGQMAADSDFFGSEVNDAVPGGGLFINSDFGAMPIASFNAPVPVYAISALGVKVQVKPTEQSYITVAAYDGNPAPDYLGDPTPGAVLGDEFNDHGVRYNLNSREGAFILGEAGFTINQPKEEAAAPTTNGLAKESTTGKDTSKDLRETALAPAHGLPGSYKIGGYFHTDRFTRFSDGTAIRGIWAGYLIGAQNVWHENTTDDQGLYLFARGSFAPKNRATLDWAIDGGLNYVGALPGRDGDILGVGYTYKHYSETLSDALVADGEESLDAESILEVTYQVNLTPYLSVQPDFQYVFQPGGRSSSSDAAVLGIRINTLF